MALNNIPFVGDDPRWKTEAEKLINDLLIRVETLEANKK